MRDTVQGYLILIFCALATIAFFWAIFLAPSDIKFLDKSIWEWAIVIPVVIFVSLLLLAIAWIGWAMVTTPPSLPTDEKDQEKKEEETRGRSNLRAL